MSNFYTLNLSVYSGKFKLKKRRKYLFFPIYKCIKFKCPGKGSKVNPLFIPAETTTDTENAPVDRTSFQLKTLLIQYTHYLWSRTFNSHEQELECNIGKRIVLKEYIFLIPFTTDVIHG